MRRTHGRHRYPYAIKHGDLVNLPSRHGSPAQAMMAALVGGDGLADEYLQDNRLSVEA